MNFGRFPVKAFVLAMLAWGCLFAVEWPATPWAETPPCTVPFDARDLIRNPAPVQPAVLASPRASARRSMTGARPRDGPMKRHTPRLRAQTEGV